ncbi:unnamed protein product, partial [Mesorhabditis spiculigera]
EALFWEPGSRKPFKFEPHFWVDRLHKFGLYDCLMTDKKNCFDVKCIKQYPLLPDGPESDQAKIHILYRRPDEHCWVSLYNPGAGELFQSCMQIFDAGYQSDKRHIALHDRFGLKEVMQLFENDAMAYGPQALHIIRRCPCRDPRRSKKKGFLD